MNHYEKRRTANDILDQVIDDVFASGNMNDDNDLEVEDIIREEDVNAVHQRQEIEKVNDIVEESKRKEIANVQKTSLALSSSHTQAQSIPAQANISMNSSLPSTFDKPFTPPKVPSYSPLEDLPPQAQEKQLPPIKDCYNISHMIDLAGFMRVNGRKKMRLIDLLGQNIILVDPNKYVDYIAHFIDQSGKPTERPGIKFTAVLSNGREVEVSTTSKTVIHEMQILKTKIEADGFSHFTVKCSVCRCGNNALLLNDPKENWDNNNGAWGV